MHQCRLVSAVPIAKANGELHYLFLLTLASREIGLALSARVPQRHMLGSLGVMPVLLEGRKEYFGLENLKGCWTGQGRSFKQQNFQHKFEVTRGILATRMLLFFPSPVSYRCKPCNPSCTLFLLFCHGRSIWQVGEGPEVLWPPVPSVSPTCVTKVNHPDVVQGNLSSALGPPYFSREMSSAKSSC